MASVTKRSRDEPSEGPVTKAQPDEGYQKIGDYAVIGDGNTVCLVGRDGSIDWMCAPHIDSPSIFAAILDRRKGGHFVLAPQLEFQCERRYVAATNVLETDYTTTDGSVRVTDALTIGKGRLTRGPHLVRHITGLAGRVPMRWHFEPRRGGEPCELRVGDTALWARHRGLQLALRAWDAGPAVHEGPSASACFTVAAGETALLAMQAGQDSTLTLSSRDRVEGRLRETVDVWRSVARSHAYDGPWLDAVERSLLVLMLLTDARTGAIAAAPTTSLPEALGGERNYDYRYAWVRDLSFTLDALLEIGVEEPTGTALDWLLHVIRRTHPRVDPVYTLAGDVLRSQRTTGQPGYRDTAPVHVGNDAGAQLQLGGFGDLMEAVWKYTSRGHQLPVETGERLADIADLVCLIWREPDAGLWELGDRAQYTSSKIGCWTALRRAVDLVEAGRMPPRHLERWRRERDAVRSFIEIRLWSEQRGSYIMRDGSDSLDCATLLAARRGFAAPAGERMLGTVEAITTHLRAEGPLFYRYSGMRDEENAFLACSFWMVEALALAGKLDDAAQLMDEAVGLCTDLGLLSEEMQPATRELRGNVPQALSHLALITAAATISRCSA